MELFESRRKKFLRGFLFPVLLLILACILFVAGISHTSGQALQKEQDALEKTLKASAVRTYALTGEYPEDLSQILRDYHITYDKSKFVVEYVPICCHLSALSPFPAARREEVLHEAKEKYGSFHFVPFFSPSVWYFCPVSYADASFFRKNLSADSKTERLRFRTWNRYHLSDYQIPAA